ncbi:MAG: hypothetical protein OEP95_02735 [Myxococcales bacterium]|nr:hypothetical protein [Myxococcales bacterium]
MIETNALSQPFRVYRRKSKARGPMHSRRIGTQLDAQAGGAAAAEAFPGMDLSDPERTRGRTISSTLSLLLHGAALGALFLAAYLAPVEEIETLIELQRVPDEVAKEEPAPAPRVVRERASPIFDPSKMAVAPQVVNPVVIQKRAPVVSAPVNVQNVNTVQAPKQIARANTVVTQARAYQSPVQVTASPVAVEGVAPAIRGKIEHVAPQGVQAGPRQVASVGNTVGIGDPEALGSGSSVREGIVTGRDVHGAKTGMRANVNSRVGDSNLRGSGGTGTGPGGRAVSFQDCMSRPSVQAYMRQIKDRVISRWVLPVDVAANQSVEMRFALDPAGTASQVRLVSAPDAKLGESAVDALRSASPFDHMADEVRCLAGEPIIATFKNPVQRATN